MEYIDPAFPDGEVIITRAWLLDTFLSDQRWLACMLKVGGENAVFVGEGVDVAGFGSPIPKIENFGLLL